LAKEGEKGINQRMRGCENVISKRITESLKANPGDKGAERAGDMKNELQATTKKASFHFTKHTYSRTCSHRLAGVKICEK